MARRASSAERIVKSCSLPGDDHVRSMISLGMDHVEE